MQILTGRPVTMAPSGMVACPHSLASQAGVDVLRAGGSAVDAAVAASSTLAVIYPHMTGVGGDAFWLIHDAATGSVSYLDGGGRAAASGTIDRFAAQGLREIPLRGILPATLTTPGAVASWVAAQARHGRVPLARCLESAIGYARDGFPVTARLAGWIAETAADLAAQPDAAALFLPQGQAPRAGSLLRNPGLARTLSALAEGGHEGFYGGPAGEALARYSREHGGFFDAADLRAQQARWGEPIRGTYRDLTLYETPAPTQGFTVLEMLNLLEPFELHRRPYLGPDHAHLMVQAKQLAYHDRDRYLADPRFAEVPIERLISRAHADSRRGLMDPARALPWDRIPAEGSLAGDTVFIAAVDAQGNAAALINSLYGVFGSCVVAGDTGVVLQNRSAYFSLDPAHPNCLAPGKTPLHTLIASMGFRNDRLWGVVGCMGADGQPQIHAQTWVAMADHGRDIQEAVEAPRWLSGRFSLGEARDTLHIESRFPPETIAELERRGHLLDRWGPFNERAGHAHGIVIDPVSGMRLGGSDPRSDGAAIGY
ncbi:MAG: gamma-glutamyltransferase family protein [Betaproteobacteria bacterium]|nr:gamma-glutamyltransferase family protein [Betaproteobacteria bacterium]